MAAITVVSGMTSLSPHVALCGYFAD